MPTYEYRCTSCGHEFEVFQKMTDPPKKRCPECRSKVEKKLSAGAGLIFKGSGFYITDYRSDDYKKRAKSDSAESGSGAAKPEGSSTKSEGSSSEKSGKPDGKSSGKSEGKQDQKGSSGTKSAKSDS